MAKKGRCGLRRFGADSYLISGAAELAVGEVLRFNVTDCKKFRVVRDLGGGEFEVDAVEEAQDPTVEDLMNLFGMR